LARLEGAITAIEQRRLADAGALGNLRRQQADDRARLAAIEDAASEAVAALDKLLAGAV
jgi:hypothetical protein